MTDTKTKPVAPVAPPKPPRDWSWNHGPIMAPLNAAAGIAAAGMVGDLAGVSPWWGAGAGAIAALGVTARAASRDISPLGLAYRAGCWVSAGGWLTWALNASAWNPDVIAALVAGAIGAGLAAPEMSDHETRVTGRKRQAEQDEATRQKEAADAAARIDVAIEWEARLERVTQVRNWAVQGVQTWPDDVGFTLEVRQRAMTWAQLSKLAGTLASDADLPHGCNVEVGPGKSRGVMLLRVSTIDTTAEPRDYPNDNTGLSFTRPLPIGMHRAGIGATIELLEDPAIIIGRRGSGKTGALQVVNRNLVRCVDALVWHIDLNGAGMSSPWLDPWLNGQMANPVIDWVAPTAEEAMLMVKTAIDIAKGRKGAYRALMKSVNDDKIPISPAVPAIVLVLDEGAEAVAANRGNSGLAVAIETLVSIARASRVQVVLSGLRATADIIPASIQAQAGVKIWMRPESQHEVAQLLGWHSGVSIEDAPHPGSGLMTSPGGGGVKTYRGYRLRPVEIGEAAIACGHLRPTLDAPSVHLGGTAYANRWDRYRQWSTSQGAGFSVSIPQQPAPEEPRPKGDGIAGLGPAAANLDASLAKLREVRAKAEAGRPEAVDAEFAAIIGGDDSSVSGPVKMLDILTTAGPAGMHWETLHARLKAQGFDISRATLYRWLDDPAVTQVGAGIWGIKPPE